MLCIVIKYQGTNKDTLIKALFSCPRHFPRVLDTSCVSSTLPTCYIIVQSTVWAVIYVNQFPSGILFTVLIKDGKLSQLWQKRIKVTRVFKCPDFNPGSRRSYQLSVSVSVYLFCNTNVYIHNVLNIIVKNRQGSPQRQQEAYKECGFPEISVYKMLAYRRLNMIKNSLDQIGRASCRERVQISVVAVSLKKKS